MLIGHALALLAYVVSLPAFFMAWAALEITIHPNKYR